MPEQCTCAVTREPSKMICHTAFLNGTAIPETFLVKVLVNYKTDDHAGVVEKDRILDEKEGNEEGRGSLETH